MAAPVTGPVSSGRGGVSIELRPPVEFILKQTGAFGRHLRDLRPLWDRFKPVMSRIEQEQFDTRGHGAWPDYSPNTRVRGPQMMVRDGALRDSLVNPGAAAKTTAMQMEWSTAVPYAGYHQEGGSTPGRPPQRKLIDLRVDDRREFEQQTVAWINDVAAGTFGRIAA